MSIKAKIQSYFLKGHHRSIVAKKNIVYSFLLKGMSVLTTLLLVPLTIDYVNTVQYGIWLTLSSIIVWFSFFDIGFGQGLKNKLIEAIAAGDDYLARVYVSTTYIVIGIISCFLLLIFLIVNPYLDWFRILNAPKGVEELPVVVIIVFCVFSIQFSLQLINTVAIAKQNVIIASLINFLGNILGLIIIFICKMTIHGSLIILCLSLGISPLIVLLIFNLILFNGNYKVYSPSFKYFKVEYVRKILQLGIKFFIIQIGLLFFYNVDNILISHIIGPAAVTSYNIAYKYFGIITMLSGIIMTPFWAAFAEAHYKGDYEWIKKTIKKLQTTVFYILILSLAMLAVSTRMYQLWVGNKVIVSFALSAVLCFYTVFNTYRTIFVYYMNGVGKLNIQIIIVFLSGLLNIPLGIVLGRVFGATGVILATTILCVFCGIIEIIQYNLLINNKAIGIWNK
ncbi:MAG: lipopolysaccharide biosynthesis protein [Janthinobacterium lividum]